MKKNALDLEQYFRNGDTFVLPSITDIESWSQEELDANYPILEEAFARYLDITKFHRDMWKNQVIIRQRTLERAAWVSPDNVIRLAHYLGLKPNGMSPAQVARLVAWRLRKYSTAR